MQVVLVDSQDEPELRAALARSGELLESAYVVDLAWLRSTPWRERVAAAFDPPPLRRGLGEISGSRCATARTRPRPACCSAAGCARAWAGARARSRPAAASAAPPTPARAAARSRCASTRSSSPARPGSRASRSRWPRAARCRSTAGRAGSSRSAAPATAPSRCGRCSARRAARRASSARACARRCCAIRPTSRRCRPRRDGRVGSARMGDQVLVDPGAAVAERLTEVARAGGADRADRRLDAARRLRARRRRATPTGAGRRCGSPTSAGAARPRDSNFADGRSAALLGRLRRRRPP